MTRVRLGLIAALPADLGDNRGTGDDLGPRGGGDFERLGQRAPGRGARWRHRAALLVLYQREAEDGRSLSCFILGVHSCCC